MNQTDIETLAHTVCFSTDHQEKEKAEKIFLNFCMQLRPEHYQQIMANYSETVIFILMEYTYKTLQNSSEVKALYLAISQQLLRLYHSSSGTFVRAGREMQKYVINSVGRSLGQIMKMLFRENQTKNQIINAIKGQTHVRFRLYLWKLLIQTVSEVDTNLGFLQYRNLVYNFQEEVIPVIVEDLVPYFMSVTESIRINQLSSLQASMNISNDGGNKEHMLLFTKSEEIFSYLVFKVLKNIICFTYNITYSEYDMENSFQNSSISFPEVVTQKIIAKDFIQSIFFIIEKLINDFPDSQFLSICLECLQKILLCRLTYIQKQQRKAFMNMCLGGLNRLYSNPNLTPKIITQLLDANIKFINNIQMHKLRKFEPQFTKWLVNIKNITLLVISKMDLNYDNQILRYSLQLLNKVLALSISPKLQPYAVAFKTIGMELFSCFITTFFNGDFNIMGDIKLRKVKQLKKISSLFFSPIKALIGMDFKKNLHTIDQLSQIILNSNNMIRVANLVLFINEISESNFYQRNMFYETPNKEDVKCIGIIIGRVLQFIGDYRKSNQTFDLLQTAILIFMEKIISESLKGVDWKDNGVSLVSNLYEMINASLKIQSDESFLIQCFQEVIRGLQSTQKYKVQYALDVLSTQLMKFKWGLKRDNFKSTRIAGQMLIFCSATSNKNLKGDALKLRKQLLKIIALISFDDVMDSFKENIEKVINQISTKITTNLDEIIYDLTGICQTVDTANIYKYFLSNLQSIIGIKDLMAELFTKFGNDAKYLKAILKLHTSMIQNKSQRLSSLKISQKLYKLIQILMPYWNQILKRCQTQEYENIVIQIHRIFRFLVQGGHVNFVQMQRLFPNIYNEFMILILQSMNMCSVWALHFPKMSELLLDNGITIIRFLPQVILIEQNNILVEQFSQLMSYYLRLNIKYLKELAQGNKKIQIVLEKTLEVNKSLFVFMKTGLKYIHRTAQIRNIQYLIKDKINQKQQYLYQIFQFCLGNGRSYPSILRIVYNIIQQMSFLFNGTYQNVMKKLGVDEAKVKMLATIWNSQLQGENDLFICNLKDWFKLCDSDFVVDIDY